ncbi:MAG: YdeI/OmpD-associated family protein [Cyclobacteriaceae bacterium]|nr:YdeI/OmpD-associated family protein [Cyclobacteriaceae bacterium]
MTNVHTTLEKFDSNLWGYHFPIPNEIAALFVDGNNRRVICRINELHAMQCALMPSADGYFVLINKTLVARLGLRLGEEVTLELEKDNSEFGHEVPEVFSALLEQDDEGRAYFYKLTPGKQRSLIYVVGKMKNIDSQLSKGLAILRHLRENQGILDFKKLNVMIQEYNQKKRLS